MDKSHLQKGTGSFIMKVSFASLVLIAILGATFAQESYDDGYGGNNRGRGYGRPPYRRPPYGGPHPPGGNVKPGSGYHSGYPPCKLCMQNY